MDGHDPEGHQLGGDTQTPALPSLTTDASELAESNPASVRSLAVAKLRRAASLPRQKDGRRPASPAVARAAAPPEASPPVPLGAPASTSSVYQGEAQDDDGDDYPPRGRIDWSADYAADDGVETLPSPSDAPAPFPSPARPMLLQRSASVSTQYPSDHLAKFHPLPTLQAIQSRHLLQRSNSAAARTEAMARLTGEPVPRKAPSPPLPAPAAPAAAASDLTLSTSNLPPAPPRPRLGRSFTISTGASGERRSVVGRRMMARLGNRAAADAPSLEPPALPTAPAAAELDAGQGAFVPVVSSSDQDLPTGHTFGRPTTPGAQAAAAHAAHDADTVNLTEELAPLRAHPQLFTTPATPSRHDGGGGVRRMSVESSSTTGTQSTHDAHPGSAAGGDLTDAFEFSDLLRRTNSAVGSVGFDETHAFPLVPSSTGALHPHPWTIETPPRPTTDASPGAPHRFPSDSPASASSPSIPILPPSAGSDQQFFPDGLGHADDRQRAASGASFPASIAPGDVLRAGAEAEPMPLGAEIEGLQHRGLDQARGGEDGGSGEDDNTPIVAQGGFPRASPPLSSSESSQATPIGRSPAIAQDARFTPPASSHSPSHSSTTSPRDTRTSADPSLSPGQPGHFPPPASLDRYADAKLAPFPGIAEAHAGRARGASVGSLSPSAVPLASGPQYFDLSTSRPASPEQSTGKKSWLAKKFKSHDRKGSVDDGSAPPAPPMMRRPSAADSLRAEESARSSRRPSVQDSLRRGSPSPSPSATPLNCRPSYTSISPGHASTVPSPAISPMRQTAPLPASLPPALDPPLELTETAEEAEDSQYEDGPAEPRALNVGGGAAEDDERPVDVVFTPTTVDVLTRLDSVLGLASSVPARPSQLSNPPRTLLLHSPCLQVVNNNTAKDRYLFLFTDLLVIGKPIVLDGEMPTLDHKFIVKSIVELPKLKLSGLRDDDGTSDTIKSQHPLVVSFVHTFSTEPSRAVRELVAESGLPEDSIASMLFKTSELDRTRLGEFLSSRKHASLLRKYLVKFSFGGVRIDEALRIFLLAVRLPTEANAGERLLEAFATQWQEANAAVATFPRDLAVQLVLAIMQLNDALNPTSSFGTFAFVNQAISADDFIAAFRSHDPRRLVGDDLLEALYLSIKKEMLSQALSLSDAALERDIYVLPTRIPSRLTYRISSDPIYITIPEPDAKLTIRLHGAGLTFDPPVLTFANTSRVSFRVTGVSLGLKTMLISRIGPTAPLYTALPISKSFEVLRAFMRPGHTFQLSFTREPTNTRRKYLFSFEDLETRLRWAGTLQGQIQRSTAAKRDVDPLGPISPQVREAAEVVSLQVLRDALLPAEPDPAESKAAGKSSSHQRSASISQFYPLRAGRIEADLDAELEREKSSKGGASSKARAGAAKPHGTADSPNPSQRLESLAASKFYPAQTGRQISFQCEQNSLIPLVLSFLQQGLPQPEPTTTLRSSLNGLGIS